MRPTSTPDEPKAYSIRRFRATMAAKIDAGKVVAVTRNNKQVGWWVPIDQPFPVSEDEIEPEDDPLPDNDGPIVIATVTADAGPRWHTLWSSGHLTLPEMFQAY
jgi:hypothetical protein